MRRDRQSKRTMWAICLTWLSITLVLSPALAVENSAAFTAPNPQAQRITTLRALRLLSPGLEELNVDDASDEDAMKAALATADAKLWSKADTRFEDVADALFEVHNEFTFLQVGAYTGGDVETKDAVSRRIRASPQGLVTGVIMDPLPETTEVVRKRLGSHLVEAGGGVHVVDAGVCSHNSPGTMYGSYDSNGNWVMNHLPWKRDASADTRTVMCRTLPAVRQQFGMKHVTLLQVNSSGYEVEVFTGLGPLRPELIWYTYSKMSPVHIDFVARRLEHKGYTVRYDARGFAWAWHTNVNHVHAATRPVPHPLKPGISRVEGPVPVYGRHLTAPVWRAAAPGAESYIMQGAWQRSYCFYVVFDAPRVVTHVRVEFGPEFLSPSMIVVERGLDPRDPSLGTPSSDSPHTRVYPIKASSANRDVKWRTLGEWTSVPCTGATGATGASCWEVTVNPSDVEASTRTSRIRLRSVAPLKHDSGSLAVRDLDVTFKPEQEEELVGGHTEL